MAVNFAKLPELLRRTSIVGIKFEGEPPFDLGVAQTVSAQVLDATVVLRVTVAVPDDTTKAGPSSVHDDGGTCKGISRAIWRLL